MPLPKPEPGLVLSYSYLWHEERRAGRTEGRKTRPSVVVIAVERASDGVVDVTVLPMTHTAPAEPTMAVEVPLSVKRHLKLDEQRSWIVVSEGNIFEWPGYDLRKIGRTAHYHFGFLPPRLFQSVVEALAAWHRTHKTKVTPRT